LNLIDVGKEVKGLIGRKIYGVSVSVDPVNKCILQCPSCSTGVYHNIRPKAEMHPDKFIEMLDKILKIHKIRYLMFYNHSDSLLHPDLDRLIRICNVRKIPVSLATVMQVVRCDLEKVIDAKPAEFRLGWSGWKNCNMYQKGFTMERLMKHLAITDKLPRYPETRWTLFFHSYKDNVDEVEPAKQFAKDHGFEFVLIPAIFQSLEKIVRKDYSEQDKQTIAWMWETPEEMLKRVRQTNYCPLIRKWLNFDAQGNATLCNNLYPAEFCVGNIFNDSVQEIQTRMEEHPFCGDCKAIGVHQMHACYKNPLHYINPVQEGYKRFKWRETWNR